MLDLVTAIRFDGRVRTGRTMPCRLACEPAAGDEVEVVARGRALDFNRLAGAWAAIKDLRIAAYRGVLPSEWNDAAETADKALKHIAAVRDNLAAALQEITRVLK